jgi:hypothetical protein
LLPYAEWLRESTPNWAQGEPGAGGRVLFLLFGPLSGLKGPDIATAPLHLGLVPLLLASLWLVVRRYAPSGHQRRIDALLIVSAIWWGAGLLLTALQPVFPALHVVLVRHLVAPVAFSVALGAAVSAEAWLELRPSQSIEAAKRYVGLLAALLFVAAMMYVAAGSQGVVTNTLRQEGMIAALTVCVYVLVLGLSLIRPWPRPMGYVLALATALQLMLFFVPIQQRTSWDVVFRDPFGEAVGKTHDRVAFGPRTESAGRLALRTPTIQGFGPRAPKRTAAYLAKSQEDPLMLPMAGVSGFVLALDDVSGAYANLRPQLRLTGVSEWGVGLFDYVPGAQMARMIYEARVVDRFHANDLRSDGPPLIERRVKLSPPEGRPGRPIVRNDDRATYRTVNVYRTDPGVLALAESYYPDWYARVDNSMVRVFPVDGAFRGIEVPAGSREVIFRYLPQSYRWGRVISFASL